MDSLFTVQDLFKGIAAAALGLVLWVWRKQESRIKDVEAHNGRQDNALHAIQLDMVEHRGHVADLKNIESRIMRIEIVIARIDERMSGRRRDDRHEDDGN